MRRPPRSECTAACAGRRMLLRGRCRPASRKEKTAQWSACGYCCNAAVIVCRTSTIGTHALGIFRTDVFEQFRVGQKDLRLRVLQRSRVRLWIVDHDLDLHAAGIETPESLGQAHRLGMGMTESVEPRLIVETNRVDNQHVAIPSTD